MYKRLMEAFSKPPERDDFNIIDVHLGSPNEIVFRILRDRMTTKSGSHYTEIIELTLGTVIDSIEYSLESPHIIVYRMVSAPEPAEVARVRRQFSRKVRELIAS